MQNELFIMLICAFNISLLCARIESGCLLFDKLGLIPFALSTVGERIAIPTRTLKLMCGIIETVSLYIFISLVSLFLGIFTFRSKLFSTRPRNPS